MGLSRRRPMVLSKKAKTLSPEETMKVVFYWPNIIGYMRIFLNIVCFFTFFENHVLTFWLYLISFTLDVVDGWVARSFNQCSTLGIVLDMVADRTGTAGFLLCLSHYYKPWVPLWGTLLTLDIISHWMQMYSSVVGGHKSHKDTQDSQFFLLRL